MELYLSEDSGNPKSLLAIHNKSQPIQDVTDPDESYDPKGSLVAVQGGNPDAMFEPIK